MPSAHQEDLPLRAAILILTSVTMGIVSQGYSAERLPVSHLRTLRDGRVMLTGLINAEEEGSLYLRHRGGETEVRFTRTTRVALEVNWRQLRNISGNKLKSGIRSPRRMCNIDLPRMK